MSESLKAIEAEADAAPAGTYVDLVTEAGEAELLVPPPGRWKSRAQTFLTQGAYDLWAQLTLSSEDFKAWRHLDPTLDEATAFLESWSRTQARTWENREPLGVPRRTRGSGRGRPSALLPGGAL